MNRTSGPRNRAVLSLLAAIAAARAVWASDPGVGSVAFANSGAAAAQKDFQRGLAQLHNFEYQDAAEAFRRAEAIDPGFAMAYWGEAMTFTHPIWMQQDLDGARAALAKLGATPEQRRARAKTDREKAYLDTIEVLYGKGGKEERDLLYSDAMAGLASRYPDDPDAQTFYALSLMGKVHDGRDVPTYMRAAAIASEVFCAHPDHPGAAHYLIHAVDDPDHAVLGLRAARAYALIAPEAAHAQHMTSHIFVALGMWDDVVRANETAIAIGRRAREARGLPKKACGHYDTWLEYGYLQQGRARDAMAVLDGCRQEAAAEAASDRKVTDADESAIDAFVGMWGRFVIDTGDLGGEVARWEIDPKTPFAPRLTISFVRGLGAVHAGDPDGARKALASLSEAKKAFLADLDARNELETSERRRAAILEEQLQGVILAAEGKGDAAVALLTKAAEEEAGIPPAFGPPLVDRPASEALGEVLLALQRPKEAMAAFHRALDRAPRRTPALMGLARAAEAARDDASAAAARATLRENLHAADPADR
ncbi:MAG: hypothetical protein U0167_00065 [bacterium]